MADSAVGVSVPQRKGCPPLVHLVAGLVRADAPEYPTCRVNEVNTIDKFID